MPTRTLLAGSALAATALALGATPAGAHVTIEQPEHAPGEYTVLTFQNGHGCDGSPTTALEIQVPEQILNVTPARNPFYDVEVTTEPLAEPVTGPHGEQITERETVITYTATEPLLDGYRDSFDVSVRIPEEAAGVTLYFPTVQVCEEGETAWIEIPADGDDGAELERPAPAIRVTEGGGGGHGRGSTGTDGDATDEATDGAADDDGVEAEATSADAADEPSDPDAELASSTSDADDGTDALTIVALVLGAFGLVAGAAGFVTARKATR
jgi:uncharacterized protein YcnI